MIQELNKWVLHECVKPDNLCAPCPAETDHSSEGSMKEEAYLRNTEASVIVQPWWTRLGCCFWNWLHSWVTVCWWQRTRWISPSTRSLSCSTGDPRPTTAKSFTLSVLQGSHVWMRYHLFWYLVSWDALCKCNIWLTFFLQCTDQLLSSKNCWTFCSLGDFLELQSQDVVNIGQETVTQQN